MSVRIARVFFYSFLILTPLGLSQNPNHTQQRTPRQTTSVDALSNAVPNALLRLQMELEQLADDLNTVDARLLQQSGAKSDAVAIPTRVHRLLKIEDPASGIRDFLQASQDRLRWDLCLKSGKLYRNLAAEVFEPRKIPRTESGQGIDQQILGKEFTQAAQLFFLSRMIPKLELQYGVIQSRTEMVQGADPAELWDKLRQALRHDDELLLGKLSAFLSTAGESPNQLAVKVLAQAQNISPSAATTVVRSMATLSPAGDVWKLAEIPGINPAFLSALECEKRALNSVPVGGFQAALLQAFNCRNSDNGSPLQAFTASPTRLAKSPETSSKAPPSESKGVPQREGIFRLPTDKELQELQNQDSPSDMPTAPGQPPSFGVSNTPVKRPKIPSWWIRCACPSDHPDAGIVFEGIRWHAPVLQCPNPELRRLEVK